MKKITLLTFCFLLCCAYSNKAQKKFSVYAAGFYNLENLFDTCHDEGKNDYEFLPDGGYHWDAMRYTNKLHNMAKALADMGTDVLPQVGCAFIGVAEVENDKALTDLVSQPPLKAKDFQFVHIEGPDKRGIDCALLYNPKLFQVIDCHLHPYVQPLAKDSLYKTRGFFAIHGKMADEDVTVIVCHLPSRFSTSFYREQGAQQVRVIKDSILTADPNRKIFIMGDMNDDPTCKSMTDGLKGKANIKDVQKGDMFNPWYNTLARDGVGTLMYQGSWNLFDQILISPNLLDKSKKPAYKNLTYWKHQVFKRDYLLQAEGKYKGLPKRTTAGGVWLNGFSDHLPVVLYLVKEQAK